ncbi:aminotransferase class V-fold PLP-dependent enzyme [Psychrosphaera haliotis]|uniref:Cysteine desulfurase n=1 Tax=Psychrosphaera haliotis TaxID=555083 RepID=A0A6N8F911_9GAMM|nr:cysteine desulfurase [Psychrosphaera haliotis]MUH71909.1 SufS family cysteine desulfurase [Psychrosphaera haliotis]
MSLKQLFPFFSNNPDLVYLDSAATTQKPKQVIDAIRQFYQANNVNVHRGSYQAAQHVTAQYEQSRTCVAKFIGAGSSSNIVWTKGTTDSINLVAQSWANHNLKAGDEVVVLASEHHANFVPWQQLAINKQLKLTIIELLKNGQVDLEQYAHVIANKPKLIAIQHVSNALGTIYPIADMTRMAKESGATVLIDGAQAVAHLPVNVEALNCDFYVFSGHKLYGPTGIGVLYIHNRAKSGMQAVNFGGEMITKVTRTNTQFREIPALLETGTPNIAGVIGLKAAIEFISSPNYQTQHNQITLIHSQLVSELKKNRNIQLYGDMDNNVGVVSFTITGESVADIGMLLDQQGIAVRCGHHCAMPLMAALGVDGTVRVSLGVYNDSNDVTAFIKALNNTISLLDI